MKDVLRALILTPWFPTRPGEREGCFILDQATALRDAGVVVRVLVAQPWAAGVLRNRLSSGRDEIDVAAYRRLELPVYVVHYPSLPRRSLGRFAGSIMALTVAPAAMRIASRWGFDVVHAHTEDLAFTAAELARKVGVASVLTLHGWNPSLETAPPARLGEIARSLAAMNRVILVGSPLVQGIAQVSPSAAWEIINNGVSVPDDLPDSKIVRRHKVRLVSVANLQRNKGVDTTIKALAALATRGRADIELVIVGDGAERESMQQMARALSLEERVHFCGYLPHGQALGEIAAADVFCVPSWREACGIAHMEAMVLGKPTIGCRSQGPSDFIEHGHTGYLVPPQDVHGLADLLQTVLADPEGLRRMGREAQRYARAHLTWRVNADRMFVLYQGICRPHAQALPAAVR